MQQDCLQTVRRRQAGQGTDCLVTGCESVVLGVSCFDSGGMEGVRAGVGFLC